MKSTILGKALEAGNGKGKVIVSYQALLDAVNSGGKVTVKLKVGDTEENVELENLKQDPDNSKKFTGAAEGNVTVNILVLENKNKIFTAEKMADTNTTEKEEEETNTSGGLSATFMNALTGASGASGTINATKDELANAALNKTGITLKLKGPDGVEYGTTTLPVITDKENGKFEGTDVNDLDFTFDTTGAEVAFTVNQNTPA